MHIKENNPQVILNKIIFIYRKKVANFIFYSSLFFKSVLKDKRLKLLRKYTYNFQCNKQSYKTYTIQKIYPHKYAIQKTETKN